MYIHRFEMIASDKIQYCDSLRLAWVANRDRSLKSHRDKIKAGIKQRQERNILDEEEALTRAQEIATSCQARLLMDDTENIFEDDNEEEMIRYRAYHALDDVYMDRRGLTVDHTPLFPGKPLPAKPAAILDNNGWMIDDESHIRFPYDSHHNTHPHLSPHRYSTALSSLSSVSSPAPPSLPWSNDGMRTFRQQRHQRQHEHHKRSGDDRLREGTWNHIRHSPRCDIDVVHRRYVSLSPSISTSR
jgi:hypothetical protein